MIVWVIAIIIIIVLIFLFYRSRNIENAYNPLHTYVAFHYVDWCRMCKHVKPIWTQLERKYKGTTYQLLSNDEEKNEHGYIRAYPTITKTFAGKRIEYKGDFTYSSIVEFIENPALPHNSASVTDFLDQLREEEKLLVGDAI